VPRSSFARSRPALLGAGLGLAGLGLVGALAGCSAGGAGTAGAGSDGGPYRDGTYTADGSYQAPSGTETITVTLTLKKDTVTAVRIGRHATDPNAIQYQTMFADGVSAIVVGKDIDELGVSRVAGSSLTSGGFRAAVEAIKKQAAES
jgi:uncharacterized protein with FMN-binding domain